MRILILGSNGLLGNTITTYFLGKKNYETFGIVRNSSKLFSFKKNFLNKFLIVHNILDFKDLELKIKSIKPNVIINCIGVTNKNTSKNSKLLESYININSLFPHRLYGICSKFNIRLIQLSSDCVFSGKRGFYNEMDSPEPIDIYGRSKLLGEINNENCITIRKSVIGHELNSKKGLLEWFLAQKNKVEGYKKAIFSGLTVQELARVIDFYIIPNRNLKGIFHISRELISKYDLLEMIADVYKKSIEIVPNELISIDRSLNSSCFNNITGYKTKAWPDLIKSMHEFYLLHQ